MNDPQSTPSPNENASAPPPSSKRPSARIGCFGFIFIIVLLLGLLAGGGVAGGWFWLQAWSERPHGAKATVPLKIQSGMSSRQIASELAKQKLIDDERTLLVWLKVSGNAGKIQAGEYTIASPISPRDLIASFRHGTFEKELTIPEGWTARQIAKRLTTQKWIDNEQAWMDLVSSQTQLMSETLPRGLDGFLFPDTYRFAEGTKPEAIRDKMLDEFAKQWKAARPDDRTSDSQKLSLLEVVTLASMIEREARDPEEMPRIASVYLNRLRRKIKLQCCATVYYSLGEAAWARPLSFADLKVNSPYNTYLNKGLPPGPIANPGRPAIEAVLRPEKTDFLFYVYRGDNKHIFSKTAKEHEAAVKSVRNKNPQAEVTQQESD